MTRERSTVNRARGESPSFPSSSLSSKILNQLFPCQRDAMRMIEFYLKSSVMKRSALVQMPMGTGKTGIMALCATQFPKYKRVLIVAPAEYLTRQIEYALTTKFWKDAGLEPPKRLRVRRFTPSTLDPKDLSTAGTFICTIQSLQQIHAQLERGQYEGLKGVIELVLFDEGHSEPALTWAKAIRSLGTKIILFTATPYRNDYRKFRVDTNYVYQYHYDDAERSAHHPLRVTSVLPAEARSTSIRPRSGAPWRHRVWSKRVRAYPRTMPERT